ncbi:hypothetical protein [Pseudomonas sp. Marseille-Q8238]
MLNTRLLTASTLLAAALMMQCGIALAESPTEKEIRHEGREALHDADHVGKELDKGANHADAERHDADKHVDKEEKKALRHDDKELKKLE